MFKMAFLLVIIISLVIFTPFAFGQELKKATWLERASVTYDQKFTNAITSSIIFETMNNNEIQFSDQLLEKIASYEEVRVVTFTNMDRCIMTTGEQQNEQCLLISMDLQLVKGDGGISALQENGKVIGDELVSDINSALNIDTKFHSMWVESEGAESAISQYVGGGGVVSAVYTMPKQESNIIFENFSETLISQDIRDGGGFYDTAKHLANLPDTTVSVVIIQEDVRPMLLFKVSHVDFTFKTIDISQISPLETIGINQIERTEYFQDLFVPLNSVFQVIVYPNEPSKVRSVKTNLIPKLESVEDVSKKGWFFESHSYDKIDARFLFGESRSVTADELIINIESWDIQNGESFPIDGIQATENDEGYVILVAIVIAAIGAALFYLKGYKRNR